MGQKVNPHGLRVGVIKNWDSRWFVSDQEFGDTLVSDHKLRTFLKKKEQQAGVPKIEIERAGDMVRIYIHCAKPGMIIGRQGTEIDKLKAECEKMLGKTVSINVVEIKQPDLDAQLVAENIASQLEKRISFRRAMKQSIGRTMRLGAKGIKVAVSGRLGGAEIARSEHYHEGTIPLQTIRADIDYGFWEANTTYGKIGVKVWIYKGEVLAESTEKTGEDRRQRRRFNNDNRGDRRDRRDRRDGGRREGGRHDGARREGGRPNPYSNYNGPRGPRAPREGGNK
ncbi:MAG: 30S ribosomal protein S3 [Clostridiales bacterium]|nr:30S ribosomal protein S3 [Clostridiales bacterium]